MPQGGYIVGPGVGSFEDPPGVIQLTSLNGTETVLVDNGGALLAQCTTGLIASFSGTSGFQGSLTATGTNQATALPVTGGLCIFTSVPSGTGCRLNTTIGATPGAFKDHQLGPEQQPSRLSGWNRSDQCAWAQAIRWLLVLVVALRHSQSIRRGRYTSHDFARDLHGFFCLRRLPWRNLSLAPRSKREQRIQRHKSVLWRASNGHYG